MHALTKTCVFHKKQLVQSNMSLLPILSKMNCLDFVIYVFCSSYNAMVTVDVNLQILAAKLDRTLYAGLIILYALVSDFISAFKHFYYHTAFNIVS